MEVKKSEKNEKKEEEKNKNEIDNLSIQVINLNKAIERRKIYEDIFLKNDFNINNIRLRATYGIEDVKIIELDENDAEKCNVNIQDFTNKKIDLKLGIKYKIFDKNEPNLAIYYKFEPDKMIIKKQKRRRNLTIGEIGCLLSHLRAIYNVANGKQDIGMIFEDDLILCENFKKKLKNLLNNAPKNFEILKLDGTSVKDYFKSNSHTSSFLFSVLKYGYRKFFYNSKAELLHGVSGATGYILTKFCAQKIINLLKTETINGLEGATDILLYITLPKKYNFQGIWNIKKPLVWQSGVVSDISAQGRK